MPVPEGYRLILPPFFFFTLDVALTRVCLFRALCDARSARQRPRDAERRAARKEDDAAARVHANGVTPYECFRRCPDDDDDMMMIDDEDYIWRSSRSARCR